MVCLLRCSVWVGLFAVASWTFYKTFCTTTVPTDIDGFVDKDFDRVRQTFDALLKDGWIQGAQFAVYYKDKLVVDLAGGYADEHAKRALKTDNYIITFSTIKSVFSLLATLAVDNAAVDFEERVSKYWVEFGQNGKENVTISNLLLHQGGVCGLDEQFSLEDSETNSEHYQKVLAQQRPLTPINERPYYHLWSYGLYLDQLMRHVDSKKRGARQLLREELGGKCGAFDIRMGVPASEFYRLARHYPSGMKTIFDHDSFIFVLLTISSWLNIPWNPETYHANGTTGQLTSKQTVGFISGYQGFEQFGDPDFSSNFGMAAAGSMSTARELARAYHIAANGGYCTKVASDGKASERVRVLSSEALKKIITKRYSGPSGSFPSKEERAMFGWIFPSPTNTTMLGSYGYGGQNSFADPETGLSFSYLTNYIKPVLLRDRAFTQLLDVTYQVVNEIRSRENH